MSANEGAAATGTAEGTLRYIAPEATGRTAHAVTWRTDLYGLGATAWHLLTGRPPFEDDDSLAACARRTSPARPRHRTASTRRSLPVSPPWCCGSSRRTPSGATRAPTG